MRIKNLVAGAVLFLCLATMAMVLTSASRAHKPTGQERNAGRLHDLGSGLQHLGYQVRTDDGPGDCTVVLPAAATHADLRRAGQNVQRFMAATYTDPATDPVMGVFIRRDGMFDPIAVVGNFTHGPHGVTLSWQLMDHSHLSP